MFIDISLLGHKSPETTAIYLHTPPRLNIKSPFNALENAN